MSSFCFGFNRDMIASVVHCELQARRLVDYRVANCRFGGLQCTTVERRLSTGGIRCALLSLSFINLPKASLQSRSDILQAPARCTCINDYHLTIDKRLSWSMILSADNALLIHHRWPELEESRQLVAACVRRPSSFIYSHRLYDCSCQSLLNTLVMDWAVISSNKQCFLTRLSRQPNAAGFHFISALAWTMSLLFDNRR
ncbi:hypothetical protein T07_14124 [Trichinella nelsoni]|uniref:Uncharacterized protein n=1 Tax=Trichinella nelsoni TaxID=6336 RepID=A0A0V0S4E6_9BILA|nr:hypothetical protein T07_14124 [Trichinella nelsoni]